MLRRLLAERFQLVTHPEIRESEAYAMTVDKDGIKLRPASASTPTRKDSLNERYWNRPISIANTGQVHLEGMMTMTAFAKSLSSFVNNSMGGPLVDKTGLDGEYEIVFDAIIPPPFAAPPEPEPGADSNMETMLKDWIMVRGGPRFLADPPSLPKAFRQMGLKIEQRKLPIEYVVIDKVSLKPTEN